MMDCVWFSESFVSGSTSIESVELLFNQIGDAGARALTAACQAHKTWRYVSVEDNLVSADVLQMICK
jgi:hypothetical protein